MTPDATSSDCCAAATPEAQIRQWIEQCVIDLSLCPFAGLPYRAGKVRIVVSDTQSVAEYLAQIKRELDILAKDSVKTETTLIAAINVLPVFLEFNDFLADVEGLLLDEDHQAHFQLASFHPQYQFAGVGAEDVGNYTNRAPYPVVQWLRAETIAKAVDATDTMAIPDHNIKKLESMGLENCRKLFPWVS